MGFRFSPVRTLLAALSLTGVVGVTLFIISQGRTNILANSLQTSQSAEGTATLSLPTLDGQTVALPEDAGQITVAYSIELGCGDCVLGAKTLARLQPDYAGRGVRFVAVATSPEVSFCCAVPVRLTAEALQPFLQAVGRNQLTWALDQRREFTDLYQIDAPNIVVAFDKQGHEMYREHLSSSDTELRAALDRLLAS